LLGWGSNLGQWVGIGCFCWTLFDRNSRNDMKVEFEHSIRAYLRPSTLKSPARVNDFETAGKGV